MNNKTIKIAGFIAVLALIFAYFAIEVQKSAFKPSQIGNRFFEKTYNQALDIDKIVIKSKNYHATIVLEDDYWRIKEAENYYGGLMIINSLLLTLNNAVIETEDKELLPEMEMAYPESAETPNSGVLMETYNKKGERVDSTIFGAIKGDFQYVRHSNNEAPYLISNGFEFPKKLYSWLQQPLLQIMPDSIETVIIQSGEGRQIAFRLDTKMPFFNENQQQIDISNLQNEFVALNFIETYDYEKSEMKRTNPQKVIMFLSESGLIYAIEVYENNGEYFLRINLSTNNLPTKAADDYIKDSSFLYKGWIFKIIPELGQFLLNYNIN